MKKIILRLTVAVLIIALLAALTLGGAIAYARKNIDYSLDEMLFQKAKEEHTVYYYSYNSDGELQQVYKDLRASAREWTDFEDISENLKKGFIAVEDREFYKHKGVNYKRTIWAVFNYFLKLKNSFGASTITQQVVKNISGDNETSIQRKAKEIFRAYNLERYHSKDDIFELYLNVIPMSGNIYGVGAASELYFGKHPSELSLAEAATLIGITNAPTKYSPYNNPEACIDKRNRVLYAMHDVGVISNEEYESAKATPLELADNTDAYGITPWFVETANADILSDIQAVYGISHTAAKMMLYGSKIILTMNTEVQKILEDYFYDTSNLSDKVQDGLNYSMVVTDPYSGDLFGIIGNCGKKNANLLFNYATSAVTPGSVLKPLALYAPLIDEGKITWSTMIEDEPVRYIGENNVPYPKNSPDIYDGWIDVNDALRKSKNTVAVKMLEMLGQEQVFDHLVSTYGFDTLVKSKTTESGTTITDIGESPLALGQLSYGIPLRSITQAYGAFANDGVLCRGRSYIAVYDRDGNTLVKRDVESKRIYSQETSEIMNQMLSNVVTDGTARQITLKESVDTAGKTGTSGNDKDRLFVGYTPYFVAGIWSGYGRSDQAVGYNNPSHLQIWDEVMKRIHEQLVFDGYEENLKAFNTDNLVIAPYCSKSGGAPTEWCELDDEASIKFGYFKRTDADFEECNYH